MAENFDRSNPYWQFLPFSETPGAIPHKTPQCVGCRCCSSHPSYTGVARAHSAHEHYRGLRNPGPSNFRYDTRDAVATRHYVNVGSSVHAHDHFDLGNTISSRHDHARETFEPHWNHSNHGNEGLCQHFDRALSLECLNRTGALLPTYLPTEQCFCAGAGRHYPCATTLPLEDGRFCERQHHFVRPFHWPGEGDFRLRGMHTPLPHQSSTNAHDYIAEVNGCNAEEHGYKRNKPICKCSNCSQEPFDAFRTDYSKSCMCRNCSSVASRHFNENGEGLVGMRTTDFTELPRTAPVNVSNARRNLTFVAGHTKDSASSQYLQNSKVQTYPSFSISTDHSQMKANNVNAVPRPVRSAKQQGIMLHQASSRMMDKPQMQVAQYFPPLDIEEENGRRLSCSDYLVGNELKTRSTSSGRNPEHLPVDLHISFEDANKCRSSGQQSNALAKSQNYQPGINKLPVDLKPLRNEVDEPRTICRDHGLDCGKDYSMSSDNSNRFAERVPKVTAMQDKTKYMHTRVHKEHDLENADFVTTLQSVDDPSVSSDFKMRLQDNLSGVWYNSESCNSRTDFPVKEPCSPILKSGGKIHSVMSQRSTYDTGMLKQVSDRCMGIAIEQKNAQDDTALNVESFGHKLQVHCNVKQPNNQQIGINAGESTSLISDLDGFLAADCQHLVPELLIPHAGVVQSNNCDSPKIERPPPPYSECGHRNGVPTSQKTDNFHKNERENDSLAEVTHSTFKNCFDIGTRDCDFPGKEDCLIDFSNSTEPEGESPGSLASSKHEIKQKMYRKEERVRYYPAFFKLYMEQHVENVMKSYHKRLQRRHQLEEEMEALHLSEKEKDHCRSFLFRKESIYNRLKRTRMNRSLFETVAILGRGAFGDVSLVRRRDSGVLYAMKTLRKKDVFRRKQVAHVKAERDLLAEADSNWVVKLYYSFQDSQCLYFVMEYIAGGDLMGLLMKLKIFDHAMAQFYTAEFVLAIESVHQLGYIHRDIKPDNILVGLNGHIKLTDFGLCTGFHWTHDSESYATMDPDDGCPQGNQRSKRNLAKSLVGTPNYIAPEVLLQSGYTSCCDWWSVGVIVFEMLVGHPPFMSDTAIDTQMKVIQWRSSLEIPESANLSSDATDLIHRLCCDQSERLGRAGADEVKGHAFFRGIDFETLHTQTAPYIPQITHPLDTSNFDPVEPVRPGQSDAAEPNVFCDLIYDSRKHAFLDFTFRRFFDGSSEQ